jgi:hypothetical protein
MMMTVTLRTEKQYSKDAINEIPIKPCSFKPELVKYDS